MGYLTQDKLVILGAAGAIGSNMMQAALTMQLTPNVCGYDPFAAGMEGAAEEIYHCAFPGLASLGRRISKKRSAVQTISCPPAVPLAKKA